MDTHYTGNKITEIRKAKGWTQKEIADKLHISITAVSKWERGLNFPDLLLMEDLAQILDISVAELLGLENEPPEQIIMNIAEISASEKNVTEKRLYKKISVLAVTVAFSIVLSTIVYFSMSNSVIMKTLFEISGGISVLNVLAVILGLTAWSLAAVGIFSRKKEYCSILSLIICSISLHLPIFATYLTMRFGNVSSSEDIIGAYNFGSAILLIVTVLLNSCSIIIHNKRTDS